MRRRGGGAVAGGLVQMPCWVYEVRSVSRDEAEKRESAEVKT